MKLKDALWKKGYDKSGQHIKKSRHITWPTKDRIVKAIVFQWSCTDVRVDYQKGWALKNWCFWIVVLEKTLESPFNWREIQLVHNKGNQSWIFIGRTDAEAEDPVFRPSDAKSWLIRKDLDVGKDWRQEEKWIAEYSMVGWHHWLNGHEFEQVPGDGEGQGSLAYCSPWGLKESDMTELPNNNNK